jgi:hypothetical protein
VAGRHLDPGTIDERAVLRRRPGTAVVPVDQEVVVVHPASGQALALNATGAVVWECLDGSGHLSGLVDDLAAGFGVPRAAVAPEVVGLARELAERGLLEGFDVDGADTPTGAIDETECPPDREPERATTDPEPAAPATFDDRYLASPPNG